MTSLQLNGQPIQPFYGGTTSLVGLLPSNFSAPSVVFQVVNGTNLSPVNSEPYTVPASTPPLLALCPTPANAHMFSNSGFLLGLQYSGINLAGTPSLSAPTLPAGITSQATFPAPIPAAGLNLALTVAALSGSSVRIPLSASAGAATATATATFTVASGTPYAFFITQPLTHEIAVTAGGSSASLSFTTASDDSGTADFAVDLSISDLPSGVTAAVSPAVIYPGQGFTVTVTAAANAPVSHNTSVTVTGTPEASAQPASSSFLPSRRLQGAGHHPRQQH